MPKTTPAKFPKDWKLFRLKNSESRYLPPWANEPLKFTFSPDEALRRGAFVKLPKGRKKAKRGGHLARR